FVGLFLAVEIGVWIALFSYGEVWAWIALPFQLLTFVHFISLIWARMRPLWWRILVSWPALRFPSRTRLALPWAVAAPPRPYPRAAGRTTHRRPSGPLHVGGSPARHLRAGRRAVARPGVPDRRLRDDGVAPRRGRDTPGPRAVVCPGRTVFCVPRES